MNRKDLISEIRKIEIASRNKSPFSLSGSYRSVLKGRGLEIAGFKEYSSDDDYRAIDWNVTARTGEVHTRVFQEERGIPVFFIVDTSFSMYTGGSYRDRRHSKIETAYLVLSMLAFSAAGNSDRTGAVFCSDNIEKEIPMGRNPKHTADMVSSLLDHAPVKGVFNLLHALSFIPAESSRRGICFVISDFKTPLSLKSLYTVGRKSDIVFIRITDLSDSFLPGNFSFFQISAGDKKFISFLKKDRAKLIKDAEDYLLSQQNIISAQGIPLVDITTADNIYSVLNKFFIQRRK